MQYIEQNLKIRSRPQEDEPGKPADPQDELYEIVDRWKVEKQKPTTDEGSVTNSLTMLTAIPEVDLGMEFVLSTPWWNGDETNFSSDSARLKNIEDTEKAKRIVAEERQERKKQPNGEEHLVASRCELYFILCSQLSNSLVVYRPNLKQKSDADIMRDAKLEAMGLPTQDDQPRRPQHDRPQMATDEMVRNVPYIFQSSPSLPLFLGYGTLQETYAKIISSTYTLYAFSTSSFNSNVVSIK